MNNVIKFERPEDKKKSGSRAVRIMVVILITLAIIRLPMLFDSRPPIYKSHDVKIHSPKQLPEGYMVQDMSGRQVKLSEMIGDNITILAFWATWCGYCAAEFPVMDAAVPYLSEHNVKIIPVARGDDTPEKIRQFFERGNITNTQSVIATTPALHKALGVVAYPTYVALDKNGMAFASLRPKWNAGDIADLFEKLGNSSKGKNKE